MKHHEYQIYYGGFKIKLPNIRYCKQCHMIIYTKDRMQYEMPHCVKQPQPKNQLRSHKKQTALTRKQFKKAYTLPMRNSAYENIK